MMACQNDPVMTPVMTTVRVQSGVDARADLPAAGVLRFERDAGAMAGTPELSFEDGALALHFADGSTVTVDGV
jgi:hypothetical protein